MDLRLFWLVEYGVSSLQLQKKKSSGYLFNGYGTCRVHRSHGNPERLHESSLGAKGLDSSYTEKERHISHTTHYVDIDCFLIFGLGHEACTYLIIYFNQLTHIILYIP